MNELNSMFEAKIIMISGKENRCSSYRNKLC